MAGRFQWKLAGRPVFPSRFGARLCPAAGSVAATWHGRTRWNDFTPPVLRMLLRLVAATQPRSGAGRDVAEMVGDDVRSLTYGSSSLIFLNNSEGSRVGGGCRSRWSPH